MTLRETVAATSAQIDGATAYEVSGMNIAAVVLSYYIFSTVLTCREYDQFRLNLGFVYSLISPVCVLYFV